jgi:hypothetical protein
VELLCLIHCHCTWVGGTIPLLHEHVFALGDEITSLRSIVVLHRLHGLSLGVIVASKWVLLGCGLCLGLDIALILIIIR